jgi:hypothetical protein
MGLWYRLVEIYSATSLTYPEKDRILALAGLAEEMRNILSARNENENRRNHKPPGALTAYLAGLWLNDIHHGLLWMQLPSKSPSLRACPAPSWSWASRMGGVTWPKRNRTHPKWCKIIGICSTNPLQRHSPEVVLQDNTFPEMARWKNFGPTNMLSCLHVWGKLHMVHVRGYPKDEHNIEFLNAIIQEDLQRIKTELRAICSPFLPEVVAGWGVLEQLGPVQACADYGIAVYALQVCSRPTKGQKFWHRASTILEVLFLGHAKDYGYCRLGVGWIFSRSLIKGFERSEGQEIVLK